MTQTTSALEHRVRSMAHSLPPSDLGSTRAIHAITAFVEAEQHPLVEALNECLYFHFGGLMSHSDSELQALVIGTDHASVRVQGLIKWRQLLRHATGGDDV